MEKPAQSSFVLGDWTFSPASNELVRAGETGAARVRLEHRSADVLRILCERRGEVVSRDDLIAAVWNGRHVSANSLPTAIHDLRQALGDNARKPVYIETLSKAGYRLIAPETAIAPAAPSSPPRWSFRRAAIFAVSVLAPAAIVVALASAPNAQHRGVVIVVDEIHNQTGDPRYDTLAHASDSVLVTELTAHPGIQVRRAGPLPTPGDALHLRTRLVLWSGLPDVVMELENPRTSSVLWSGFAFGPENVLPTKIRQRVDLLAQTVTGKE